MTRQYEDTETRRRQVAEAALRTIAEEGVARFTTRAVAGRVGISDGTLFRHFGSKQEIVLEAMNLLEVEIEAGFVSTGDPLDDLEAFYRHRAALVGAEGSVGRLIFSDGLVHLAGETGRGRIVQWRLRSMSYLADRFGPLIEEGRVKPDVDAQALIMFLQGSLLTFALRASSGWAESESDLSARIDHAWAALQTTLFV